jgi:HAD superfamily phosphoserine phosphatase-like hydrolase
MRLAIFDIDGTIFRSSLVIQLCEALVMAGIFPKTSQTEIEKEYLAWLDRKGSYEAYINKVVKIYIKHIKGKRYTKVKRVADAVIREQKNRTYRYTRNLIQKLKQKNYYLVAVSGSPDYIVESYAKAIGFNACFGTRLEVLKDKFTGKVVDLDSAFNKAKVVKKLAVKLLVNSKKNPNLSRLKSGHLLSPSVAKALEDKKGESKKVVDWKQSTAVGDTEGDVGVLALVGKPIAFNPNLHLAKIAKRKNWPIVVERKDAIYSLNGQKAKISS